MILIYWFSGLLKERNKFGHRPTVTRSSKNWTVNTARRGIFFSAQKCASFRLVQNASLQATAPSVMRLSTFVTKSQNVFQPVQTRSNRFSPVNQSLPALTIILTMIVRVQVFSIFSVLIEKMKILQKKALKRSKKFTRSYIAKTPPFAWYFFNEPFLSLMFLHC